MKRSHQLPVLAAARVLVVLFMLHGMHPNAGAVEPVESRGAASAPQQFFCSSGYDPLDCRMHAEALMAILHQYPAPQLGAWNWVLVRTEDWQPLLRRLRLDPRSPAFTAFEQRSTYLEEALFHHEPRRTAELEGMFHISAEKLLPMAITHELGHAICQERDEGAAERVAGQLRNGAPVDCNEAHGLTQIQRLELARRSPGLR